MNNRDIAVTKVSCRNFKSDHFWEFTYRNLPRTISHWLRLVQQRSVALPRGEWNVYLARDIHFQCYVEVAAQWSYKSQSFLRKNSYASHHISASDALWPERNKFRSRRACEIFTKSLLKYNTSNRCPYKLLQWRITDQLLITVEHSHNGYK